MAAQLAFVGVPRSSCTCAVFLGVLALYGAVDNVVGGVADAARRRAARAWRYAAPMVATSAADDERERLRAGLPARASCRWSLFSGAFFPISQLPDGDHVARLHHADLARRRPVPRCSPPARSTLAAGARSRRLPARLVPGRLVPRGHRLRAEAGVVTPHRPPPAAAAARRRTLGPRVSCRCSARRRGGSSSATSSSTGAAGSCSLTGMLEPVLYLLSIGIGVGELVGDFTLADGIRGRLRRVRRAGHARRVGDERRAVRLDVQHLLPAQVRQALRRDARDADRADATSPAARSPGRCCAARSTRRRSSW